MSEAVALRYLRPPADGFWLWDQEGRVLQWSDSRTIAFLPEVHAAAARFKGRGLPPFGALALGMGAMREAWKADNSQRAAFTDFVRRGLSPGGALPGMLEELLRDALARLDALAALPEDLRSSAKEGRALLIEMLFDGVPPKLPHTQVPFILEILAQRFPEMPASEAMAPPGAEALSILKSLAAARLLTDVDAIRLRQRTGLEALPGAAEVHISEKVRGLLSELQGDPQLAALARLTRQMLAVIATPRRLVPEQELPLGGFSDITNRGHLDRLLLTELAHDDLTLAVRVAMNEALYLRREAPRSPQAFTRTLLIDCGIRLWGVSRLFATAVALAFAATTPKEARLEVFAASRSALRTVDLASRAGLLSHLEKLEPSTHPGEALPAFREHLNKRAGELDEAVLITHPDALAESTFQRAIQHAEICPRLEATVTDSGRFSLSLSSLAGKRPLEEAVLDLHEIMAAPDHPPTVPSAAPLVNRDAELPAMLRLFTSPFRLPLAADLQRAVSSSKHGLIAVAGRALMHWAPDQPARTLVPVVPYGTFIGLELFDAHDRVVLAIHDSIHRNLHYYSIDLTTKRTTEQCIPMANGPLGISSHNGFILSIGPGKVEAFTLDNIVPVGSVEFPKSNRQVSKRYLLGFGGKVLAICCDGVAVMLRDVDLPSEPIAVFSRTGTEGPIGLYGDGAVHTTTGDMQVKAAGWETSAMRYSPRVSSDGNRIVVEIPSVGNTNMHFAVDLSSPAPAWRSLGRTEVDRFIIGQAADLAAHPGVQVRRRMNSICLDRADQLTLVSRRQKLLTIDLSAGILRPGDPWEGCKKCRNFGPPWLASRGVTLRSASWSDGSRAWMDARGILHLKSTDPGVPELSILLAESAGAITAWSSDGKTYGDPALLQEPATGTPNELRQHLRAFVARLR